MCVPCFEGSTVSQSYDCKNNVFTLTVNPLIDSYEFKVTYDKETTCWVAVVRVLAIAHKAAGTFDGVYTTSYGSTEDPGRMQRERISGLKQWLLDRIDVMIRAREAELNPKPKKEEE